MSSLLSRLKEYSDETELAKYSPGDKIRVFNPSAIPPRFSYEYLNINTYPEYCFNHKEFTVNDYNAYFKLVKDYSSKPIDDSIGYKKITMGGADNLIINYLRETTGYDYSDPILKPDCGHFHLYDRKRDSTGKSKCPVIHFFIEYGIFYVVFYDPFHTVHETAH